MRTILTIVFILFVTTACEYEPDMPFSDMVAAADSYETLEIEAEVNACLEQSNWIFVMAVFRDEGFTQAETLATLAKVGGENGLFIKDNVGAVFRNSAMDLIDLQLNYHALCGDRIYARHK